MWKKLVCRGQRETRREEDGWGLRRRGRGREEKRSKVREPGTNRAAEMRKEANNVRERGRVRRELGNFRRAYGPGWCGSVG